MRINSIFHVFTLLTATLIFSAPLIGLAQEVPLREIPMPISEAAKATADAQRDAEAHLNKPMWFAIGCFLPVGVWFTCALFPSKDTPLHQHSLANRLSMWRITRTPINANHRIFNFRVPQGDV